MGVKVKQKRKKRMQTTVVAFPLFFDFLHLYTHPIINKNPFATQFLSLTKIKKVLKYVYMNIYTKVL